MKINYFEDTDTAFIEFTSERVAETRELCENIHIDLDEQGNLVSMKIEHAKTSANILDFTFERQEKQVVMAERASGPSLNNPVGGRT